jgi:uncharacterized protein (TIGR02594 family)
MSFKTAQPGDPAWLKDAFSHLGLAEIPGVDHNPLILEMFAEVGFPGVDADETSWCAAFANWLAQRAGMPTTGALTARSFLNWGSDATAAPRRGDFVVIKRGSESWQGHVFLWLGDDGDRIWGIGGNQGKIGAVTVTSFARSTLLGIRRPPVAAEAYHEPLVRAVQQALWDRGYKQVGMIDGDYGRDTRGAIVAFELDHDLPPVGKPTHEILARILAAAPKPVSELRAEADPADVRDAVPEMKATWQAQLLALWGMIVSLVSGAIAFIAENVSEARGLLRPVLEAFGDVPVWLYVLLLGGCLLVLWLRTRAATQGQVAAFRSGERR